MREEAADRPRPCRFQDRGTGEPSMLGDYRCPRVGGSVVQTGSTPDSLAPDWNNQRPWMGQLLRPLAEACPRRDPCAACETPCVHLKVIERDPLVLLFFFFFYFRAGWKPNETPRGVGNWSSYFGNTDRGNRNRWCSLDPVIFRSLECLSRRKHIFSAIPNYIYSTVVTLYFECVF